MKEYTIKEASELARCTRSALLKAIARRDLKAKKFGRDWRIWHDDLMAWVNDPAAHKRGNPHRDINKER